MDWVFIANFEAKMSFFFAKSMKLLGVQVKTSYEPVREKTNNLGSVQDKAGCTVTEDG